MGYDVHITRAEEWSESEEAPITAEEWHAYASTDPTLDRDGSFGSGSPHFYNWRVEATETWLDWFDGAIYTKNPPQHVRAHMFAIAMHFDARVQGDDGELYGDDGKVIPDETYDEDGRLRPEAMVEPKPWTEEEIALFIEERDEERRGGTFEQWLDSFEGVLEGFPDEIRSYVESTPAVQARKKSGLSGRTRGRRHG